MKRSLYMLMAIALCSGCSTDKSAAKVDQGALSTPVAPEIVIATGKVEPENDVTRLSAPVGGIIMKVLVKDGDPVTRDQLLVQLDDELEQRRIQEVKAQIRSQESQIDIERAAVKETAFKLSNKKSLLEKTLRMTKGGAETQQVYDDVQTEVKVLEATLDRLMASVRVAASKLDELLALLRTAETEVGKKQLRAPFDGVILDLNVNAGEALDQFSTYAEFAPKGSLVVRAEVDELFCDKVKTGQHVEVIYPGNTSLVATGRVTLVAPYLKKKSLFSEAADDQEDRRVREVRIRIDRSSVLIINSKVECKINCKS